MSLAGRLYDHHSIDATHERVNLSRTRNNFWAPPTPPYTEDVSFPFVVEMTLPPYGGPTVFKSGVETDPLVGLGRLPDIVKSQSSRHCM